MQVIDDTRSDLDRLIAADFGVSSTRDIQTEFINWLHFRGRRVPRLPRRVLISRETQRHLIQYPAIEKIRLALEVGGDVEPWLNRIHPDGRANYRTDMMFNDWQIIHFHLGSIFQSPTMIRRTGPLLFVHITGAEATILDVQPHGSWTMISLLENLLRTNPTALERYEARGVTPTRLSNDDYKRVRAGPGNVAIEVGGRAFFVGGGMVASGHASRLWRYHDQFFLMIEKIHKDFESDRIDQNLKLAIYSRLGIPVLLGAHYCDGAMAIIDKNRSGLVLYQMNPIE